jgi:hypothetical protein
MPNSEKHEPKRAKLRKDNDEPKLAKLLKDKVDPKCK